MDWGNGLGGWLFLKEPGRFPEVGVAGVSIQRDVTLTMEIPLEAVGGVAFWRNYRLLNNVYMIEW